MQYEFEKCFWPFLKPQLGKFRNSFSSPFDLTTVIGYLEYSALEIYINSNFCASYFCGLFLFINSCLYLEALCADFVHTYRENDELNVTGRPNILEMKQRLIENIKLQAQNDKYGYARLTKF